MFRGPSFIVSTMQEETTPIFKRLWYDWTQQQPGIEPTNPLGQCWVPPIVAFYDQQGLLRTYSLPGGSIRSPHPGSPRDRVLNLCNMGYFYTYCRYHCKAMVQCYCACAPKIVMYFAISLGLVRAVREMLGRLAKAFGIGKLASPRDL